jgi:hypothetical protein
VTLQRLTGVALKQPFAVKSGAVVQCHECPRLVAVGGAVTAVSKTSVATRTPIATGTDTVEPT